MAGEQIKSKTLTETLEQNAKAPEEVLSLLKKYGFDSQELLAIIENNPINSLNPKVLRVIVQYGEKLNGIRRGKLEKGIYEIANLDGTKAADENVSYAEAA